MKDKYQVAIIGMCLITTMEMTALCLGYNGTLLKLSMASVAGLGGWVLPSPKEK